VPVNDNAWDQQANLVSAAHAIASWARARRAQWANDAPAPIVPIETVPVTEFDFVAEPAATPQPVEHVQPPAVHALPTVFRAPEGHATDSAASATPGTLADTAPLKPWLIRGGIAAAVLAGVVVGGRYLWGSLPSFPSRTSTTPAKAQTEKADAKAARPDAKAEKADPKS